MSRYGTDARELVIMEDCFGFEEIIHNEVGHKEKVKCSALSEMRNKDCLQCKFYKTKQQFDDDVEKHKKRIILNETDEKEY